MTKCSFILLEQTFRRSIMEIHVETIGKDEFYFTQGISRPGSLPDPITHSFHILIREVIRVPGDCRFYLVFYDAWGNIPVRTKNHLVQVAIKHHCIVPYFTNYNPHVKYSIISIVHMKHEFRNVHNDQMTGWFLRHPSHSVHIQKYLPQTGFRRYVHVFDLCSSKYTILFI